MPRPKIPLISRRAALQAALNIVDQEGLEALSIRRLGDELRVNGASLYHHFKNKEDILIGVTQLALEDVVAPRSPSESWRSWLPMNANRTRQVLVAHPELIPLMLERKKLGIGARELGASVQHMLDEGVPIEACAPLIHSLELVAILCALDETSAAERASAPDADDSPEAESFRQAEEASALSGDELFEALVGPIMTAVEMAVQLKIHRTPKRARGRSTAELTTAQKRSASAAKKAAARTTPAKKAGKAAAKTTTRAPRKAVRAS